MEQDSSIIFRRLTPEEQKTALDAAVKNKEKLSMSDEDMDKIWFECNENREEYYKKILEIYPHVFNPLWFGQVINEWQRDFEPEIKNMNLDGLPSFLLLDVNNLSIDESKKIFFERINLFKKNGFDVNYYTFIDSNLPEIIVNKFSSFEYNVELNNETGNNYLKIVCMTPYTTPLTTYHTLCHEFCHALYKSTISMTKFQIFFRCFII